MSSAVKTERAKVYETILSSPGMSEKCKLVMQLSRQNVLLLSRLIETGLLTGERTTDDEIMHALPTESLAEFRVIHEELLSKSGLTEFYQKLQLL